MIFSLKCGRRKLTSSVNEVIEVITKKAKEYIYKILQSPDNNILLFTGNYGDVGCWLNEFMPRAGLGIRIDIKRTGRNKYSVECDFYPMTNEGDGRFYSTSCSSFSEERLEWTCFGWFDGTITSWCIESIAESLGEEVLDEDDDDYEEQYYRLSELAQEQALGYIKDNPEVFFYWYSDIQTCFDEALERAINRHDDDEAA